MATQLDRVALESLQVMGRVRLPKCKGKLEEDLVIGLSDGVLALAKYRRAPSQKPWWMELSDDENITVCGRAHYDRVGRHYIKWTQDEDGSPVLHVYHDRVTLEFDKRYVKQCGIRHPEGEHCEPLWHPNVEDFAEQVAAAQAEHAIHTAARKSPLIVLAG
jgi:hypothetical protein